MPHTSSMPKLTVILLLLACLSTRARTAESPGTWPPGPRLAPLEFDSARYIPLDEIHRGMKGYGLTVFHGTAPEPFDLEVVSVVKNFSPGRDAFLIKCDDPRFAIAKMVAGCSGSPVFLDGRLAGAMAFGWVMSEEPLYGVTPIAEMLEVRQRANMTSFDTPNAPPANARPLDRSLYTNLLRDTLLTPEQLADACRLTSDADPATNPVVICTSAMPPLAAEYLAQTRGATVVPLAGAAAPSVAPSPAATSGSAIPPGDRGDTMSAIRTPDTDTPPFQPGSAVTIPLMHGDMAAQVLGTVTEVRGPEIFAFGHGWDAQGPTLWPLATGYVHTFVSRKDRSFKLGNALNIVGSLRADESVAVYGRLDRSAPLTDATIEVHWPHQSKTFHVQIARDMRRSPVLAISAILGALEYRGSLPAEHSLQYDVKMSFDNLDPIEYKNIAVGDNGADMAQEIMSALMLLLNNPWQTPQLTTFHASITVIPEDRLAELRALSLDRRLYRPGQTVQGRVELEPLWQPVVSVPFQLTLPDDLPDGDYELNVGSEALYRNLLQTHQSHRMLVLSATDLRRALQERLDIPRDRLYVCLVLPGQGVALESDTLPQLPPSRAMLLTDPQRTLPTARFQPLLTEFVPLSYQLAGAQTLTISVARQ